MSKSEKGWCQGQNDDELAKTNDLRDMQALAHQFDQSSCDSKAEGCEQQKDCSLSVIRKARYFLIDCLKGGADHMRTDIGREGIAVYGIPKASCHGDFAG